MREKQDFFVINTSLNLDHLPVSLGVSAVPIVDVLYNRVFVTRPHSLGLPRDQRSRQQIMILVAKTGLVEKLNP